MAKTKLFETRRTGTRRFAIAACLALFAACGQAATETPPMSGQTDGSSGGGSDATPQPDDEDGEDAAGDDGASDGPVMTSGDNGNDSGDCARDEDCAPAGQCIAGLCVGTEECGDGVPCAEGWCLDGTCVVTDCWEDQPCSRGVCLDNRVCVDCIEDSDCPGIQAECFSNECSAGLQCDAEHPCPDGNLCTLGTAFEFQADCLGPPECLSTLPGSCGDCIACGNLGGGVNYECLEDPACVEYMECIVACTPLSAGSAPHFDPCMTACGVDEFGFLLNDAGWFVDLCASFGC